MAPPSFGRYKIAEEIGRGAMGVVYRATDPAIGRTVAIKVINEAYLASVDVDPTEYFARFKREAEVAGRLNHPGIAKIWDLGPNYIVMEYISGRNLATLLGSYAKHHLSTALDIVGQVAAALDHAHANGIVHRDVKPANIIIQPDGSAKVMDFGLARIDSSTLTAAGEILGSASYMAPEIVRGQPATARSDVFSLGVVAYEIMTGDRPFSGASISAIIHNIVKNTPKAIHRVNLNLPPDYDDIFARVLAKEPETRYPTAGEFAQALVLKKWSDRDPTLIEPLPAASVEATTVQTGATIRDAALAAAREAQAPEPAEATIVMQSPEEHLSTPTIGSLRPPSLPPPPPAPSAATASQSPTPSAAPSRKGLLWGALGCGAVILLVVLGGLGFLVARLRARPAEPATTGESEASPSTTEVGLPSAAQQETASPEAAASKTPATPLPASIAVTSEPTGARVSVDGQPRGTTPIALSLPPGHTGIIVEKSGYRRWRREMTLASGEAKELHATLEAAPAARATPPPTPPPPATKTGDLVALTPDVTPPRRLSGNGPDLPRNTAGFKSTTVVVEFVVTEDGDVKDPKVIEPAGDARDNACLQAVSRWRYTPATKDGVRVRVIQQARFRFEAR
jgi:serine/threonine-protein kinase